MNLLQIEDGQKKFLTKKLENLAQVIKLMNDRQGPDLLGICEVENQQIAQKLLEKVGRDDYQIAQYNDGWLLTIHFQRQMKKWQIYII